MRRFTVHKGKRYRARMKLGFVQRVATNEMVADKFLRGWLHRRRRDRLRPQAARHRLMDQRRHLCRDPERVSTTTGQIEV